MSETRNLRPGRVRAPARRVAHRVRMGPWPARTALAFVLLTLVALVVVPVLVQQRVDRLREHAELGAPARTLVTQLQFNLARELGALNELLLGGGPQYSQTYAQSREAERALFAQLEPLAERLGPNVIFALARAETLAERWHARAADEEFVERRARGEQAADVQRELGLFEDVLSALGEVDAAIVEAAGVRRDRIVETEENGLRLTVVLGVLAFLAAATVAGLGARVRHFAEESERQRQEAEDALAESARLAEARTRLIRGVTHDVKNPLGAAKGYAELLALGVKGPITAEQQPLVEGIERSVDAALAIIADLLDVARADSGGLAMKRERVELQGVLRATVGDQRAAATSAGHELTLVEGRPIELHTDPGRVRQVVENLLSNAIKYTPAPGRIVVRADLADDDGAGGPAPPRAGRWAAVMVIDTGPGIPRDKREIIFDEFSRLDDHAGVKGHGLGLAISRRIARLLGGDLVVADAGTPGATFILWLPCRSDATSDEPAAAQASLVGEPR